MSFFLGDARRLIQVSKSGASSQVSTCQNQVTVVMLGAVKALVLRSVPRVKQTPNRASVIGCPETRRGGFTLVELLVVIAIIAVLASLLLPVLGRAREKAHTIACISNLKQLQLGWATYLHDSRDWMPPNTWDHVGGDSAGATVGSWVVGNARELTATNIQRGVQFPYNPALGVYHCPADRTKVTDGSRLRFRSYSLECYIGGYEELDASRRYKTRLSQMVSPSPARIFMFIDEDDQSIEDGTLATRGPTDGAWSEVWVNLPASRHGHGVVLSFADGHVERWRWKAGCIRYVARPQDVRPNEVEDLRRLQYAVPDP
jgi:prepilin-type N-terminal cleavage/methylation domain-containing protein/prepilin-type processing-associated H-X9-DG protein